MLKLKSSMMKIRKSNDPKGEALPLLFKHRSIHPELIDLGPAHYSPEEYEECLIKLDQIGTWLGGDRATFAALRNLKPNSILDVGCGGGFFTAKLAKKFPQAHVVGIDLNPQAIAIANKRHRSSNLSFELRTEEKLIEPPKSYDIVLSTLVCHHLTDDNLPLFFTAASQIAKKKVILNDLHRHPLAYHLFRLITPLFHNRLIQNDGLLSIRRGFTKKELMALLHQAKITRFSLKWKWAFRWLLEINCDI